MNLKEYNYGQENLPTSRSNDDDWAIALEVSTSEYRTNEFPKPIKIGRRAVGWPEDSLIAWQAGVMGGSHADS